MKVPREQVSTALFNLLSNAYPFTYTEMAGELPTNVPPSSQPAMYLVKPAEDDGDVQAYGAKNYELMYGCLVYLQKDAVRGDLNHLVVLDRILDAIDQTMQSIPPGEPQTLGGLVAHAQTRGARIMSGIVGQKCVLVIPISVLTGI